MRRGAGRRSAAAGACALAAAAAACQGYTPITLSEAPRAESVQVELTAAASERLTPALGANVEAVEGRVEAVAGDSVRLAVTGTVLRNG